MAIPPPADVTPPAHAWDWVARQRLVWTEARRRLVPAPAPQAPERPADVPDWSALLDRGPLRLLGHGGPGADSPTIPSADRAGARDWSALATRAEVMAALRADYADDPAVRAAVDGSVTDVAFLGRRTGSLGTDLGVRTPPRGMRWWWEHLGGTGATGAMGVASPAVGPAAQLTLSDVLVGYGDPQGVG